jgi:hypothetical protein
MCSISLFYFLLFTEERIWLESTTSWYDPEFVLLRVHFYSTYWRLTWIEIRRREIDRYWRSRYISPHHPYPYGCQVFSLSRHFPQSCRGSVWGLHYAHLLLITAIACFIFYQTRESFTLAYMPCGPDGPHPLNVPGWGRLLFLVVLWALW